MLKPLRNNLLLEVEAAEEITKGGLYIPDKARKKSLRARVVAAGPGYMTEAGVFIATEVKEGDVVVYHENGGVAVKIDGKDYLMLSEDLIIAKFEGA